MGNVYVWLLSFFFLIALLLIIVFQLMCLADLDFDYINPYDMARRINAVIPARVHWAGTIGCCRRQHQIDVSKVYNMLKWEKKQRLFKLGCLIFPLLLSVFW
ncbi:hypothetical protein CRG98_030115 [Punica granatum]|uniref:Uncharacterized protein n=1 Tax=Punica granatum TaxID=22663 RepID=A0A2I0IZS1_PUNGR|nr:hypothetical protein CRG98_030115 [Punica granatum]